MVGMAVVPRANATTLDTLIATNGTLTQGDLLFSNFTANILGGALTAANVDVAGILTPSGASGLRFTGVPAGSFSESTARGGGGARETVVDVGFTVTVNGTSFRIRGVQQALDPAASANNNAILYGFTSIPPSTGLQATLHHCITGAGLPGGTTCPPPIDSAVLSSDASSLVVDRQIQIIVGQKFGATVGDASTGFFDISFTEVARTPGTPPPDPRPAPAPIGTSGDGRWQIGSLTGLYVVDPAAGEIAIQGATSGSLPLVNVDYNKGVPPADTVVTLNGVHLVRWSGNPLLQWTVDPLGPQPPVGSGGFVTLVASSASAGAQRELVLPCPADVSMSSTPPVGSSLAGATSVQIDFASNIVLNPPGIPGMAGVFPTATLVGYDAATGRIPPGANGLAFIGPAGAASVTVPIQTQATTTQYLMDVRWPGPWQVDGETGAFCGLAKRWAYDAGAVLREEMVPVVLRLQGRSLYTSELTLTNTGATALHLTLAYTSSVSGAAPAVTETLGAGQQLAIGDVIGWLQGRGVPIGAEDVGTLRVTDSATGATPRVSLQARTTSPSGIGRAGVGYSAASTESLGAAAVAIYGLRENAVDRSNLAIVNAGTAGPATYRVTLISGDPGDGRRVVLTPDVTLQPGEWRQINGVLGMAGLTNGYATVERVSGSAPFLAYGVVNDNGTNDGSYMEMSGTALPSGPLIIPAIVETPVFETELTLTNPGAGTLVATLSYVESLSDAAAAAKPVIVTLSSGEQRVIAGIIDFLRSQGAGIGARGASHAGALTVSFAAAGSPAAGWAGGRTTAAAVTGGRYGLSYPGVPLSRAATTEALVTGLRQDAGTRSNLAFVNAGALGQPLTLRYDVYDGTTMQLVGQSAPQTLQPGEWRQINGVLGPGGVTNGWVRVVKLSGDERFIAYGVVNDGGSGGPGTNDGSYVAMSGAR